MKKYSMLQFESFVRHLVKSRLQEVLNETDSGNTSIDQKQGYGAYGPGGPRNAGVQISGQPMMDEDFLDDRPLANPVAIEATGAFKSLEKKMGGNVPIQEANKLIKLLAKKYPGYEDIVVDTISYYFRRMTRRLKKQQNQP